MRLSLAGWQSGYAAACKAVDGGSIPPSASKVFYVVHGPKVGRVARFPIKTLSILADKPFM